MVNQERKQNEGLGCCYNIVANLATHRKLGEHVEKVVEKAPAH